MSVLLLHPLRRLYNHAEKIVTALVLTDRVAGSFLVVIV